MLKLSSVFGSATSQGDSILGNLVLVVDVLTILVGALSIVSIIITGVQYFSSSSKEVTLKKAKHHMFEIIIGLAAYAVVFAILQHFLPEFQ